MVILKKLFPFQLFSLPKSSRGPGDRCAAWISFQTQCKPHSLQLGGGLGSLSSGTNAPLSDSGVPPSGTPGGHRERPGSGGGGASRGGGAVLVRSNHRAAARAGTGSRSRRQTTFLPRPRNGAPAFRSPPANHSHDPAPRPAPRGK